MPIYIYVIYIIIYYAYMCNILQTHTHTHLPSSQETILLWKCKVFKGQTQRQREERNSSEIFFEKMYLVNFIFSVALSLHL